MTVSNKQIPFIELVKLAVSKIDILHSYSFLSSLDILGKLRNQNEKFYLLTLLKFFTVIRC